MQPSQPATPEQFYPLVRRYARSIGRRCPRHVDVKDLEQAGAVALVKGLLRYDRGRPDGLESYLRVAVRGAILDELRRDDHLTRGERRAARALARTGAATTEEAARAAGVDLRRATQVKARDHRPAALTEAIADGGLDPEQQLTAREQATRLAAAFARLGPREAQVLRLSYDGELSLRQIGEELGVSESRVCQIRSRAMKKLREMMTDG